MPWRLCYLTTSCQCAGQDHCGQGPPRTGTSVNRDLREQGPRHVTTGLFLCKGILALRVVLLFPKCLWHRKAHHKGRIAPTSTGSTIGKMDPAVLPSKPDRRAELLGATIFLTIWGFLFVAARLSVRIWGNGKPGWDDLAIAISTVSKGLLFHEPVLAHSLTCSRLRASPAKG